MTRREANGSLLQNFGAITDFSPLRPLQDVSAEDYAIWRVR